MLGCFDWDSSIGFIVLYSCLFSSQSQPLSQIAALASSEQKEAKKVSVAPEVWGLPSFTQRHKALESQIWSTGGGWVGIVSPWSALIYQW